MSTINLSALPGYSAAFQATASERAQFNIDQPQFHWNLVQQIKRALRDDENDEKGWRTQITTMVKERSWLHIKDEEGRLVFPSLAKLIEEGLDQTVEEFVQKVEKHAGPDMVELLQDPLKDRIRNSYSYVEGQPKGAVERVADQRSRETANAPGLAIDLFSRNLITKSDMQYLGKLNAQEQEEELLEMLTEEIEALQQPPAGANSTERRRFRKQIGDLIKAKRPAPTATSTVVRLPNDAEKAYAVITKLLDDDQLSKLKRLMVTGHEPVSPPKQEQTLISGHSIPSWDDAVEAAEKASVGGFTTLKTAYVLTGQERPYSIVSRDTSRAADNEGSCRLEGNGWAFKRPSTSELNARNLSIKRAWELVQVGEKSRVDT